MENTKPISWKLSMSRNTKMWEEPSSQPLDRLPKVTFPTLPVTLDQQLSEISVRTDSPRAPAFPHSKERKHKSCSEVPAKSGVVREEPRGEIPVLQAGFSTVPVTFSKRSQEIWDKWSCWSLGFPAGIALRAAVKDLLWNLGGWSLS